MNWRTYLKKGRERLQNVRTEMEKGIFDLVEQVMTLILGGMLGGQALSISQGNYSLLEELLLLLLLIVIGLTVLERLHFLMTYKCVLRKY